MIHAHDGAAVAEVHFAPFWRRRLAFAFRFPATADFLDGNLTSVARL
jgi:hypothetical protein